MDSQRLAAIVRRFGHMQTRRSAFAAVLTILALSLPGAEVHAKKKGKKKCRRKPPPTPQLSCQDACPENCSSCLHRKVDSLLCSSGFSTGLKACSTDSDCVGVKVADTAFPYCVTQVESRISGTIDDVGDGTGICTNALVCAAT